jgi:hypothetical protein
MSSPMLKSYGRRPVPEHYQATPESIARAIETTRQERAEITRQTGVVITDDGAILPPFTMGCPFRGCAFQAHGRSDLSVVRSVCAHYKRSHLSLVQE